MKETWITYVIFLAIPPAAYIIIWSILFSFGTDVTVDSLASLATVLVLVEILRRKWLDPRKKPAVSRRRTGTAFETPLTEEPILGTQLS